jgi:exopolyphosphatase/guanosine-5'-triphosphate,3'-diphosphate pyrophosphatase
VNSQYFAVIDIGSNSVRLVIYLYEGHTLWPVFNEKILAGLGRDMRATGSLNPQGRQETLTAMQRFKVILQTYKLQATHVVATAACREANDGSQFLKDIEDITGLSVRVLSGEEEAFYSAIGVKAGHFHSQGIMGDLGGSSLELRHLNAQSLTDGISLPLGPFALGAPAPLLLDHCQARINDILDPISDHFQAKTLHAVGGAWRNLALIWFKKKNHPLHIVQHFQIARDEVIGLTRFIANLSPTSLERVPGIPKRRLDNIGYAALVLQCLMERLGFETIVFSAYGLREGLIIDSLADHEHDPLISGCQAFGARQGSHSGLGPVLGDWALKFYESINEKTELLPTDRLIRAAAHLSDIGALMHPDHRAELAREMVLRAPIPGQDHKERVFLAAAVHSRYSGQSLPESSDLVTRILGEEGLLQATRLGLLLRLGCDLSAKSVKLLQHSKVYQSNQEISLKVDEGWEGLLLGDQTLKRARSLAIAFGMRLKE